MKNRAIRRLMSAVLLVVLLFAAPGLPVAAYDKATTQQNLEYLASMLDMLNDKYNGSLSDEQILEGALKGVFGTLDPYTEYFNLEEGDTFFSSLDSSYEGIGIGLNSTGGNIIITKVYPGSPAEAVGICPGDRLATVNGQIVTGATTDKVAGLIRGKAGTKVTLGIMRAGSSSIKTVELKTAVIVINPVFYEIRDGVGYIRLDSFSSNSSEYINKALEEMDRKKVTRILLDLRNNGGGYVDQCISIAEKLVPEGLITRLDYKSADMQDVEYYSKLKAPKYKLAVLVNGGSASASEILAGAVQDTGAGKLIGSKTFGKAKVQQTYPVLTPEAFAKYRQQVGTGVVDAYELITRYNVMPLQSEIMGYAKITVGMYYTPKGRLIDNTGLTPDLVVKDPVPVNGMDLWGIGKLSLKGKLTLNSSGSDVINAERILKALGYEVGTPDYCFDSRTEKAVAKFRADNRLSLGKTLDTAAQKLLNTKLDALILKSDRQYAKAIEYLRK